MSKGPRKVSTGSRAPRTRTRLLTLSYLEWRKQLLSITSGRTSPHISAIYVSSLGTSAPQKLLL